MKKKICSSFHRKCLVFLACRRHRFCIYFDKVYIHVEGLCMPIICRKILIIRIDLHLDWQKSTAVRGPHPISTRVCVSVPFLYRFLYIWISIFLVLHQKWNQFLFRFFFFCIMCHFFVTPLTPFISFFSFYLLNACTRSVYIDPNSDTIRAQAVCNRRKTATTATRNESCTTASKQLPKNMSRIDFTVRASLRVGWFNLCQCMRNEEKNMHP